MDVARERLKRLTATVVAATKAPMGARLDLRDAALPGFMLRVAGPTPGRPIGRKVWSLLYKVRGTKERRRLTVGTFPVYDLDTARQKAIKALHEAGEGRDPAALPEFAPLAPSRPKLQRKVVVPRSWAGIEVATLDDLVSQYLDLWAARKKSGAEDRRILHRALLGWDKDGQPLPGVKASDTWRGRRLNDPKNDWHRDIVMLRNGILADSGRSAAHHFFAIVRKMFNWAEAEGIDVKGKRLGKTNPLPPASKRERWLETTAERVQFWEALSEAGIESNMRRVLRFILVTGQRPGEVRGLHKRELDRERGIWILPKERAKNGRAHLIPLSPVALAILDQAPPNRDGWVFPSKITGEPYDQQSLARAMNRLQKPGAALAGIERLTPHDLRRTCNSGMRSLTVSKADCRMVLNHQDGDVNSEHYDLYQGEPEKRRALGLWSDHLMAILTPPGSNVVGLRFAS